MAPFGATMVILFGLPDSPLAQPKNIIAGHILTTLIGLSVLQLFGVQPWSLGLAVGLAVALMLATGTTHPPAGANPLLVMLTGQGWSFLITPVAIGAVLIVLFGLIYHRVICRRRYPTRWL
ncbi:HPP family protein [Marinobacterium sp. CAU 1594]|nr:HPP family protein [Marinobacterium arenosum]